MQKKMVCLVIFNVSLLFQQANQQDIQRLVRLQTCVQKDKETKYVSETGSQNHNENALNPNPNIYVFRQRKCFKL